MIYNLNKNKSNPVENYHRKLAERKYARDKSLKTRDEEINAESDYIQNTPEFESYTPAYDVNQNITQNVAEKTEEETNKGGFWGGLGYAIEQLGLGLVRSLEGISDYVVGGVAELFGQDEWADEQMRNDWINYDHANEWYNPDGVMQFVGDVASGVGGMLPSIGAAAIPGIGPALSTGMFMTSAAGQSVSDAAKQNEGLSGNEWLYGTGSGLVEGLVEKMSGGTGKLLGKATGKMFGKQIAKSTAGKLAANFVGEGLEEVASDIIDPALRGITGVNSWEEVKRQYGDLPEQLPHTFLVGGTVGSVLGSADRAGRAIQAKGFNNLNAIENASEFKRVEGQNAQAAVKGGKVLDNTALREKLSDNLRKMDSAQRSEFISRNGLENYFNADGGIKSASENSIVSQGYNAQAYSENIANIDKDKLKYKPTANAIRPDIAQAVKDVTLLSDGNGQYVITDGLSDGVNGFYDRESGITYLSGKADAGDVRSYVASHELVHTLEGSRQYERFANTVLKEINSSEALKNKYNIDRYIQNYSAAHDGVAPETLQYIVQTEIVADFAAKEMLTDEAVLRRLINRDRNIVQRILDWVRDKIKILVSKGGDRSNIAFYKKAERQLAKALDNPTGGVSVTAMDNAFKAKETSRNHRYLETENAYAEAQAENEKPRLAMRRDADGNAFVEVSPRVADSVETPKQIAETLAQIVRTKFSSFIDVHGQNIGINQRTAREWLRSKSAEKLLHTDSQAFLDKVNAFENADELLKASKEYVGEAAKHSRKDNFVEFARGIVAFKVGDNGYEADIIVGATKSNTALLYDVVNIQHKEIVADTTDTAQDRRSGVSATINSISNNSENVNSLREKGGDVRNSLKSEITTYGNGMSVTQKPGKYSEVLTKDAEIETIRFSLMNNRSFENNVKDILSMSDADARAAKAADSYISIMKHTPDVILNNVEGAQDLEVIIRFDALYLASRADGALDGNYHNLGAEITTQLPQLISDPDAIVRMDNGRLNILAEMKTDKGSRGIISIELNTVKDINSKYSKYNLVVSAFSAKDNYVRNLLQKRAERVEYIKKDLPQVNHQLHESLAIFNERSNEKQSTSQSPNAETLNRTSETLPRIKTVSITSIRESAEKSTEKSKNIEKSIVKEKNAGAEAQRAGNERMADRERNAHRTLTPSADNGRYSLRENWHKLGQYTNQEIMDIERAPNFRVAKSYPDIARFIDSAMTSTTNKLLFIGKIDEQLAGIIKKQTDIDVTGKSIALSANDIKHIFNNHGNVATESQRGQVAVTKENIENILDTIIKPDNVRKEIDNNRVISIIFEKQFNGRNIAITVLSNKRNTLTLKSAYIIKGRYLPPSPDVQAPSPTSETLGGRVNDLSSTIIAQKEEKSTTEEKKDKNIRYSLGETVEKDVLAHYGKTYRWAETGYIFKDGTRLDMSGRNEGAAGGYRSVDHRDIFSIYENSGVNGTEALIEFMSRGNIRVNPETPGINVQVEPTEAQYKQIANLVETLGWKNKEFSVDLDNARGETVETLYYEGAVSARKVVDDIRYYFKTGKRPYKSELSDFRYSLAKVSGGRKAVVIEDNILAGVKRADYAKTVREAMRRFSNGIPVSNGRLIKVNKITRGEYTNSKNTQHYRGNDDIIYTDKMKASGHLDEIVLASDSYVNEGLKHTRNDNIKEFARGNVLLDIAGNQYAAKIIVGFTGSNMVLYDVVDFKPTKFTVTKSESIKKDTASGYEVAEKQLRATDNAVSSNTIIREKAEKSTEKSKNIEKSIVNEKNAGEERFSIAQTDDGKRIVVIDTDQDIFDGVEAKDYPKTVRRYMLDKFQGKIFPVGTSSAFVNRNSVNEYTFPANRRQGTDNKTQKMRAGTELDNLLKVGEYIRHEADDGRHPDATRGWDYYKTWFTFDGENIYEGIISIKLIDRGDLFYDITQIENTSAAHTAGIAKGNSSVSDKGASTTSIREKTEKSTENSKKVEKSIVKEKNAGEERFSIAQTDDGKRIVVIDTDQDIFDGVDRAYYGKTVRDYMRAHFRGKTVNDVTFTAKSEREYTMSKYTQGVYKNKAAVYEAKMKAATELDNLVATSEYMRHEDAKHVHGYNTEGYNRYRATFELDGKMFTGELLVALRNNNSGIFYDIVNIEKTRPLSRAKPESVERVLDDTKVLSNTSIRENTEKSTEKSKNIEKSDDVRYSLKPFAEQVDGALDRKLPKGDSVLVSEHTPEWIIKAGFDDLPMLITQKHLRDINTPEEKVGKGNYHGISREKIKQLPIRLQNPVMLFDSLTDSRSIVVVTDMLDDKGRPVVVAVRADGSGMYLGIDIKSNFVTSFYGKDGFASFILKHINQENLLYWNKEKSRKLYDTIRVQFPQALTTYDSDIIIRMSKAKVNSFDKNNLDNRFSLKKIDSYTEKQYNDYGWVRANDVISSRQWADFNSKFTQAKKGTGQFVKTKSGDFIISVNDMTGDSFGVDNVLVYVRGSLENPKISKIVKINLESETDIDIVRRGIYEYEKSGNTQASAFVASMYGQEIVGEYTQQTLPDYREYSRERGTRGGGEESGRVDGVNRPLQDGRGDPGSAGETADLIYSLEKPTEKVNSFDKNNLDNRFSLKKIDSYTEKQYNDYGWVRANDVLSNREYSDFNSKLNNLTAEIRRNKTAAGEYIIPVNDMHSDRFGINNVLVFAKGTYQNPKITRIIRIKLDNETDIDLVRSKIYESKGIIGDSYWDGILEIYNAETFQRREQREGSRAGGGTDSQVQNGERGTGSAGETADLIYSLEKPTEKVNSLREKGGDERNSLKNEITTYGNGMSVTQKPGKYSEVLTKVKTDKLSYGEIAKDAWTNFQINFSDAQTGIVKAGKKLGIEDIDAKTNYVRAAYNAANSMLDENQADISGKRVGDGLKKIFSPVYKKGEEYVKEFYTYLLLKHHADRIKVDKTVLGDLTAAEALQLAVQREIKYPEFKTLAAKVWKYNDNLLQYRVDTGLITAEAAAACRKLYPHYVPTFREGGSSGIGGLSGKYNLAVKSTLKTAKGSTLDIMPIDVIMARQTMEVVRAGRINQLKNSLYDALESRQNYSDMRVAGVERVNKVTEKLRLTAPVKAELYNTLDVDYSTMRDMNNQISFYKDGNRITLDVTPEVFAGFEDFAPNTVYRDKLIEVVAKGNTMFKKLVTSANPFFLVRNFFRDLQDSLFYTKHGIRRFLPSLAKAYKQIATKGEMWNEYLAAGGLSSGLFDYNTGIKRDGTGLKSLAERALNKLEYANMFIEQAPRLAEYMLSRQKGLSVEQSLLDSADVTTNFGRGGKTAKMLNRTVMPFLNPSIQGWSKLVRTVFGKKNVSQWIQLIVRSLLLGIGLTALNDLLNGDDEDYKAVSLRDKENYYLFNIGDGQFLKLPKGRVLSVFGSLYLRGKESAKGNANAWDGYLESAASAVSPVDNFTRTIFSPLTDAATNTTWYGGVIEGRGLQNLSPENRYDESTSEIAKALGKALNYSPKKIHYIIDQYSGVIGDIVLPMTTAKSERGLIASNFTVNTAVSNRYSGEFYDKLDEITYAKNDGDRNAAFKYRYLNDIAGEVSDMYAKRREIENSDLSQQDKSAQSEAVSVLISQTQKSAVKGLDVLDEILNSIDYDKRVAKLTQGFAYRQLTDDEKEKAAVKMYDYYYALAMNKAFGAELDRKQTICNMINDDRIFIYLAHISSLTADTDSNGNTINGSRKKKVETYVDGLPLSSLHKYLLMLLAGYKLGDIGKNKVAGYFNEAALDNSIRENLLSFVA